MIIKRIIYAKPMSEEEIKQWRRSLNQEIKQWSSRLPRHSLNLHNNRTSEDIRGKNFEHSA